MRFARSITAALMAAALAACSVLPKGETVDTYRLPASSLPAAAVGKGTGKEVGWALRVNAPYSGPLLDSTRIAVAPPGAPIGAFRGARWSDRAPLLLRDRLVDAFRDDGRVRAVSSDASRLHADLELDGDLRAFESEYRDGQPRVRILFEARLVQGGSRRILASRRFEVAEPAADASVGAAVAAFGQAGDRLARGVVDWTLQRSADLPAGGGR